VERGQHAYGRGFGKTFLSWKGRGIVGFPEVEGPIEGTPHSKLDPVGDRRSRTKVQKRGGEQEGENGTFEKGGPPSERPHALGSDGAGGEEGIR